MQRMMLQWSELHPYNACHGCWLRGAGDQDRLRESVRQVFERNRFGVVELVDGGRAYRAEHGDQIDVRVVETTPDNQAGLARLITEELNRPFVRPRGCPIRLALLAGPDDSHFLIATYDHWTADSVSSRLVLRQILGHYLDCPMPGGQDVLSTYDGTYRHAFRQHLRMRRLGSAMSRAIGRVVRPDKALQPAYGSLHDWTLGYRLREAPDDFVGRLRHWARAHDASVHDVILSALACALDRHLPRRNARDPDRRIALATMVDARRDAVMDLQGRLGSFLTYQVVRLSRHATSSLPDMIDQVRVQTTRQKATAGHFDSVVDLKLMSGLWPALNPRVRTMFLRRAFPLSGSVSNVVISEDWFGDAGSEPILDYFRASPTGPVAPLVLTPTTYRDGMNVGISYRATAFAGTRVDALLETFFQLV